MQRLSIIKYPQPHSLNFSKQNETHHNAHMDTHHHICTQNDTHRKVYRHSETHRIVFRHTDTHGRMGKGNKRCSHVIGRVLAESLLGAVKSKANRDVTIRLDCLWHCCFYCFIAQNSG